LLGRGWGGERERERERENPSKGKAIAPNTLFIVHTLNQSSRAQPTLFILANPKLFPKVTPVKTLASLLLWPPDRTWCSPPMPPSIGKHK
jgi:hypothetical protein